MMEILHSFILLWCLSLIAWTDWRTKRIPNKLLLYMLLEEGLFLSAGCLLREQGKTEVLAAAAGFLTGGGIFFMCYLLFRGKIGAGDAKLSAVTGLWLGSRRIVMVFVLTFLLAAICCVFLLMQKRADHQQKIPLAPFLLTAAVLVMVLEV